MYKGITIPKISQGAECHQPIRKIHHGKTNDSYIITVVGQPNSGKTTLFNALTGSNFKTANYPGVTVEYSTGELIPSHKFDALIVDSPGIISLNPESPDEKVTVHALFDHPQFGYPDIVIITTDCTQLSRQLYLVKQMIDCGFKVVVALTMEDLLEKNGYEIDLKKLEEMIKVPVTIVDSRNGKGIYSLIEKVKSVFREIQKHGNNKQYTEPIIPSLDEVLKLYSFTEDIEKKVIHSKTEKLDIAAINEKHFGKYKEPDKLTLNLDKIILHPYWGLIIFFVSMGVIFTSIFWIARPLMDLIDAGFVLLGSTVSSVLPQSTWYNNLITEGLIGGVGSVMVFVPQIVILFLFLGFLEDTGYLARAAMLIDKPLSKFGLNGRSFVPMISGFACAIPAIMSARTITNRKERYLTIFIIPLMSCSARLPVYALLFAFVVPPDKPWIAGIGFGALYFFSLIIAAVVAGILSKFKNTEQKSTFMLELPAYRKPVLRHVFKSTYYKASVYIQKAGPIIIAISLLLWLLSFFPNVHPKINTNITKNLSEGQITKLEDSERLNSSYAADIGRFLQPFLEPVGWDWRIGVSLISAFAAREVFVSAIVITFSITEDDESSKSLVYSLKDAKRFGSDEPLFTPASSVALIIYFMFAMQCISTIAVVRKETGSWKIPFMQIVLYTSLAYFFALISYNLLKFFGFS